MMRTLIADFTKSRAPLVCLTAYTTPIARILDPHVDMLLVGDSLGMVLYGFETTLPVTLDMMIAHGAAVVGASSRALIVVDMPYGTYEESPDQALRNATRVLNETGCAAIKLEGGQEMGATIRNLVQNGVPVMGHVGLMPQSVEKMGGYQIQGRGDSQAEKVKADALAVAAAGAFSVVIEGTIEPVARAITEGLSVPTIGIGASPACDGQILVVDDLLGMFSAFTPHFVKRYAELAPLIDTAIASYAADVRARRFPAPEHCFYDKKKIENS